MDISVEESFVDGGGGMGPVVDVPDLVATNDGQSGGRTPPRGWRRKQQWRSPSARG